MTTGPGRVVTIEADGALVVVDVLFPGSQRSFARLTPVLAQADWFSPTPSRSRR